MKKSGLKQYPAACKACGESALGPLASTYICSLAMIVVKQNKGNPERMSEAFKVAVRHAFNDHEGCDKEWCRSLSDDEATRSQAFKRLPHGKPLFGTVLLRLILELFEVVGSIKVCGRLAHG